MRYYAVLLRTVALFAIVAGILVPAITHEAPQGDWMGASAVDRSGNAPRWTADTAARFHDCVDVEVWKRETPEQIPTSNVVVMRDASVVRMPFAEAVARAEDDNAANDVWTIGGCQQ